MLYFLKPFTSQNFFEGKPLVNSVLSRVTNYNEDEEKKEGEDEEEEIQVQKFRPCVKISIPTSTVLLI